MKTSLFILKILDSHSISCGVLRELIFKELWVAAGVSLRILEENLRNQIHSLEEIKMLVEFAQENPKEEPLDDQFS